METVYSSDTSVGKRKRSFLQLIRIGSPGSFFNANHSVECMEGKLFSLLVGFYIYPIELCKKGRDSH